MKRWYLIFTLAAGFLFGSANLFAHGGTYVGPEDIVPPGGRPPAGTAPPTPTSPPDAGSPPITPPTGGIPTAPELPTPPPPPGGSKVSTHTSQAIGADLSTWVFWWEINKDRFLNLKSKVRNGAVITDKAGPLAGLGSGAKAANTLAPTRLQIQNLIVPSLLELVQQEDNQDIATASMIALAKIGIRPSDCREIFARHLDASIQEVKETAVLSYGIMKDEGAIPILESLLLNSNDGQKLVGSTEVGRRTRAFAAYSLALIGQNSNHAEIKNKIADLLYTTLMTDNSASKDIRVACVIGLGSLDLPNPTEVVLNLSFVLEQNRMDQLVLAHIPNAMAKLLKNLPPGNVTRNDVIDQILALLKNRKSSTPVKQSSVQALGMLALPHDARNQDIFETLVYIQRKGRDQQLKHFTAISMAYLGVADPNMRQQATDFLVTKMKKSSTPYEPWCGLSLGVMAFMLRENGNALHPLAMEATLEKFLKEKSPEPKGAYAIGLGLMNHEIAKPHLRLSIDESSVSQFRGYASVSLGLLNAKEHVSFLKEIVAESKRDPEMLRQASIGLGLMQDRDAVSSLLVYLVPENGRKPRLSVLSAVASALGFIGDKSSVTPLVDTMNNKTVSNLGRAFAAVSLGMVSDKDDLPWNALFGGDLNYRAAVTTLSDQQSGILDIR